MKALVALALVLLLVACERPAAPANETALERIQLTYQPFQCVQPPWQSWYNSTNATPDDMRTDEELIAAFYGTQGINLTKVERYDPGQIVCDACEVCPTSYVFRAQVRNMDAGRMRVMGWNSTVT